MIYFKRARLLSILFFFAYCALVGIGYLSLLRKGVFPLGMALLNPWFLVVVLVVTGAACSLLVYRLLFAHAEFRLRSILYNDCDPARFLREADAVRGRFPRETGMQNRLRPTVCIACLADGQFARASEMLEELELLPASLQPEALYCKGWCALAEENYKGVRDQIIAVKALGSSLYLCLENALLVQEEKYAQAKPRLEAQLIRCATPCHTIACKMLLAQTYDALGEGENARSCLEYIQTYGNTTILKKAADKLCQSLCPSE